MFTNEIEPYIFEMVYVLLNKTLKISNQLKFIQEKHLLEILMKLSSTLSWDYKEMQVTHLVYEGRR